MTGAVWRRENIFESRPLGVWKKTDRRQFQHTVSNFLYLNKNKITMVSGTSLELSKCCRVFSRKKKKARISLNERQQKREPLEIIRREAMGDVRPLLLGGSLAVSPDRAGDLIFSFGTRLLLPRRAAAPSNPIFFVFSSSLYSLSLSLSYSCT